MILSKNSFAPIVAILALTITISAHPAENMSKTFFPLPDCYIPSSSISHRDIFCTDWGWPITTSDFCTSANASIGDHIYSGISFSNRILPEELETECVGNDFVCCVFVEEDFSPCPDQPAFWLTYYGTYRISSIRCKAW